MAIDPTISLSTQGSGNLLQTLSGATQLRGQIQAQKSNGALSRILQQSVDPTTGQVDYNKVQQLAAQDPDAAYNLPQLQGQILTQKSNQLDFDAKKFELATKQADTLANGFGGLLASNDLTPSAVFQVGARAVRMGLATPEDAVKFTADMPTDPGQLKAWVQQKYLGFSDNVEKLKALQPQMQTINTGGQQIVAGFDPVTGRATGTSTAFNNTMSPEAAAQPTQVFDPATGTMRNVTRQQFADMAGGQPAGAPGMAGGAAVPGQGGGLGTGRLQPITGAPGLQAGPALGSAEAAQVVGKGAAEASINLQSQAEVAPQAIYQLQNMRSALSDINTGPNADWRGQAQALALGVAPSIAEKLGIDPQKVASQEEFKKFSVQLAQATAAGLGDGTDSKLASAIAANPNISLSKLGNQQIIDVLIATQRATQAKNSAWQNSRLPPEQFNKFSTQWNKEIDPRVFAAQDMDNDHVWKMVDSLPKRDQESFMKSWAKAQAAGYVQ